MTIRLKTVFFLFLGSTILIFLYIERGILSPFVVAAIFAYIFNPLVNFFTHQIKLPRILGILFIYSVIVGVIGILGIVLTKQVFTESAELKRYIHVLVDSTNKEIKSLPTWIQPTLYDALSSLNQSKLFAPYSFFPFFPAALSRIVSILLFVFSGFYFLKEGRHLFDKLLQFIPREYKFEVEVLERKINAVLNGYLRGQILIVFIISFMLFVALSIIGVRFALILAIFSGLAEIVPIIGPIVAASTAALVMYVTQTNNFSIPPLTASLVVILIYFVVRQFQDYFLTPHIMGRITKLHPLVILFSVIAGEHIAGILGLLLAVPTAAVIRILLEYGLDKVHTQKESSS